MHTNSTNQCYAPDYKDVMLGVTPATPRAGWSTGIGKKVSVPSGKVTKGQCHAPDYKDVMLGVTPATPRAGWSSNVKKVDGVSSGQSKPSVKGFADSNIQKPVSSSWFGWIPEWLPQTALLGLQYGVAGVAVGGLGYYLGKRSHQQIIDGLQEEKDSIEASAAQAQFEAKKIAAENEQLKKALQAMDARIKEIAEKKPEATDKNKEEHPEDKKVQYQNSTNTSPHVQSDQRSTACIPGHSCCYLYNRPVQPVVVQPYVVVPPIYVRPQINYWQTVQVSAISQPFIGYMNFGFF